MSKPWDNEPTPIADMLTDNEDGFCSGIHDFQDIERRMRAAERLLEIATVDSSCVHIADEKEWLRAKYAHLEAARKEDGR